MHDSGRNGVGRILTALLLLCVGLVGYAAADIADLAPGVLTIDPDIDPDVLPPGEPVPSVPAAGDAEPALSAADGPVPDRQALAAALATAAADPDLGPAPGIIVRDGLTGAVLFGARESTQKLPASTVKLLSAATVLSVLDPQATMATRVLRGAGPEEIVLVAGGDTMLARGAGDPDAAVGHAGLDDLARATADALDGTGPVTLGLDARYAAGPRYAPGWYPVDIANGATQAVTMIGLADQRPAIGDPSPRWPEEQVLRAFAAALAEHGVTATLAANAEGEIDRAAWSRPRQVGAELARVESAPYLDVLEVALDDSDNALTENLVRQAAAEAEGYETDFAGATALMSQQLTSLGIDMSSATLADASGLTNTARVSVDVISQVLQLGVTGALPPMRQVVAALPVAGYDGTLARRFIVDDTASAAGIVRGKTGTLTGSSALAGTTVTADGRLLTFAVIADGIPRTGTLAARAALERLATILTDCGC